MSALPDRIRLARLPTPLERFDGLSAAWGGPTIWVKRDDLTGFGTSGNKVRKLEFHFAAAQAAGATSVVTCGAVQSNHCRATALVAARLGMQAITLLRSADGAAPDEVTGNHLLIRLAGAEVRYVTPAEYQERDAMMADVAAEVEAGGGTAWVIPEGASDDLGMLGFVLATRELADQLVTMPAAPAAVWHPASSAGTTAGLGWGAHRLGLEIPIVAVSVGDPADEIAGHVREIWAAACERHRAPMPEPDWRVTDRHVGAGYGVATAAELATQAEATARTGLLFDPTYTGKAMHGLREEIEAGTFRSGDHVVFWHTGGGFALFSYDFGAVAG